MARRMRKNVKRMRRVRRNVGRSSQFYGKKIKQPVQFFTRMVYRPAFYSLAPGAAATGAALNFQLSNVPNASEFTQLYDQYQIKAVKVTLIPRFTESSASVVAQQIGNMWSCLDYDDSTAPTALTTLLQYQNVKRTQTNKVHSRYLKPAVANEVFATGIATAYNARKNVWLDCSNDAVEHYAVKFWFDQTNAGVTYDLQMKFYLAFKNVR